MLQKITLIVDLTKNDFQPLATPSSIEINTFKLSFFVFQSIDFNWHPLDTLIASRENSDE